jgi:hypothetical protein
MDKNTLGFVTLCISCLSRRLNLSKTEVYHRLKSSGILYEYIVPSYDVLHTFSTDYVMDDLTDYMKEKGVLASVNDIEPLPMNGLSKQILQSMKHASIIECLAEMKHLSLEEAMEIFYNSETFTLIDEGVADLHCRSDKYLAEEIWLEYTDKHKPQ